MGLMETWNIPVHTAITGDLDLFSGLRCEVCRAALTRKLFQTSKARGDNYVCPPISRETMVPAKLRLDPHEAHYQI